MEKEFGTFERPFAPQSPWNSRPIDPKLEGIEIATAKFYPAVEEGPFSTAAFLASASDGPMEIKAPVGKKGIWDPDAEEFKDSLIIPRWPAAVTPATGGDGHADIVDSVDGLIHSFYQLRYVDGVWRTTQHSWSRLDGRGWGDPAHYFQGARATGVPTIGGVIRRHEMNDGDTLFRHALAMSLNETSLSPSPAYVYPATAADWDAAKVHLGTIPEGTLMMLPPDYDTSKIANPVLKRVADTLKVYGAYVVDRNQGSPFIIYAEIGGGFHLHGGRGRWDNAVATELQRIRAALRMVVSASGWLDGRGNSFNPPRNFNILSMRGAWSLERGTVKGVYDTRKQAVVFSADATDVQQSNSSGRNITTISWAVPVAGQRYQLTAVTEGGGRLRLRLRDADGRFQFDSGELKNGKSVQFVWPAGYKGALVTAIAGSTGESAVGGTLVRIGSGLAAA
ncbi:MAG TPA: Atrophin-1 multi-domain protein [Roseateles sp.]